jgi:hypothetical protein
VRRRDTTGRNDRGAILIIALLLLLALTSIGLVAMQAASNDLNLTGNARVAQVARNIAMSGAEGTMAFAGMNPSGFNQFVATNANIQMTSLSDAFFDTTATDGTGSFGREGAAMSTALWQSRMLAALTTHRAPGFQMGEFCFRRYITQTDGLYSSDPLGAAATALTVERNAQARAMTAMFVGPVACP